MSRKRAFIPYTSNLEQFLDTLHPKVVHLWDLPMYKAIGNSLREGVPRAKILRLKYKAKLEILGSGEFKAKIPPL